MDLRRLRRGELTAAVAGIVLLVSLLFLDWYHIGGSINLGFIEVSGGVDLNAWDKEGFLGILANLVVLAAGVTAVGLAFVTATSRTVALPVASSALTAGLGIGAVVMVIARMLFQPLPNEFVDLKFGIWIALISAIGVAYGGWESMQEEGTTFEEARDRLQGRFTNGAPVERRPEELGGPPGAGGGSSDPGSGGGLAGSPSEGEPPGQSPRTE